MISTVSVGSSNSRVTSFEVSEAQHDDRWDEFLAATRGGHHAQSSSWGRLKGSSGWRAVRVLAREEGRIVGGSQMLLRTVPLLGAIAYQPRGPLVAEPEPVLMDRLLSRLLIVARRYGVRLVATQPPYGSEYWEQLLISKGFQRAAISILPTATALIGLADDPDEIFQRIHSRARSGIRHGIRNGVTVRIGGEADIPTFHRLLTLTAERQGFQPEALDYYFEMWQAFSPHNQIHLFIAELSGEPLSAEINISFGPVLTAKRRGWSGAHRGLCANDVLQWEILKWAHAQGFRAYDQEGVDARATRATSNPKESSISPALRKTPSAFKLKFGGEVITVPGTFVYLPNPPLRVACRALGDRLLRSPRVSAGLRRLRSGV